MLPLLSSPMYRIHRCNLLSLSRGDWLGHGRTSLVDGRGLVPAWTVTKDRSSTVRQSGRSYHNQGGEGESTHGVAWSKRTDLVIGGGGRGLSKSTFFFLYEVRKPVFSRRYLTKESDWPCCNYLDSETARQQYREEGDAGSAGLPGVSVPQIPPSHSPGRGGRSRMICVWCLPRGEAGHRSWFGHHVSVALATDR